MKSCYRSRIKRLLLTSSFILLYIIIVSIKLTAGNIEQTITLNEKNAPLEKVFKSIEKQCSYFFVYNSAQIRQARPVTIEVSHVSLTQALAICFKEQPFSYAIVDNLVIIKAFKKVTILPASSVPLADAGNGNIKGRVLNEKGEPIEGVTVMVKGTKIATSTNNRGEFFLELADRNNMLVFTGANIETYSVLVGSQSELLVKLTTRVSMLDEAIVIPYGITTERFKVGNITKIKGAEIERQPVGNFLLALEGRVPGLFITQNTGVAGGGVTVRVQGQNSMKNGSDPLYVVDGMPIGSQDLIASGAILGPSGGQVYGQNAGLGSALTYINPSDIESVEVLKDASATAIYGSRAANGAILITTKSGKIGKTKIDINLQQGWGKVTRKLDMLNTQQYLEMRREAKLNDNAAITATDYDINGTWDTTRYTDWQKELIGNTAYYTNINTSISGGNTAVQYLVGATWHRETTVFPGSFADEKASIHFSLNCTSDNQKFRLQFIGNYLNDNNQLPSVDLTNAAIGAEPHAPALYTADGSLNWAPNSTGNSTWSNPLRYLYVPYKNKVGNLTSSALLSYHILPGLELKSNLGYKNTVTKIFRPITVIAATNPENRPSTTRRAAYANGIVDSWNIEPQISYKKGFGKGLLDALVGSTILQDNFSKTTISGVDYNSDDLMENPGSATTVTAGSTIALYKYYALYGRLNYNWDGRYILDLTARRDGTSRFGSENQFHNFGAGGIAWIFSQENFFNRNIPFISFGKIKASFGTAGNDQIADYAYLNLYGPVPAISVPYQGITTLTPGGLTNPAIAWEETRKLQIGLDLGFLKDRILIDASFSRNRSSNQLLNYNLPMITGFGSIFQNRAATVQNTSWEFSINTINVKTKNMRWSSSFNVTIPDNKLVDYPGLSTSTDANTYIIGKPLNITRLYHFLGVNPATGIYVFSDKNGSATLTPNANTDKTIFTTTFPRFYGGFQNSFSYKGLQLDVLFQFTKQVGPNLIYFSQGTVPGQFSAGGSNQPVTVLKRWKNPGDLVSVQKYSTSSSISRISQSDVYYVDASYIRLKNLSLSYELPGGWKRKAHIQGCRIYMLGQNLLTFTNFKGLDPENQSNSSLPPLRVLTLGLQVVL